MLSVRFGIYQKEVVFVFFHSSYGHIYLFFTYLEFLIDTMPRKKSAFQRKSIKELHARKRVKEENDLPARVLRP